MPMKSRSFVIVSCILLMLMPAQAMTDRGATSELFSELVECVAYFSVVTDASKHVMIGGIDATNEASIRFHERLGFERVAHFREVGRKIRSLARSRVYATFPRSARRPPRMTTDITAISAFLFAVVTSSAQLPKRLAA